MRAGGAIILFLAAAALTSSDLTQDRNRCAPQLVGLSTCLPYVQGKARAPTVDCCSGMKQVLSTGKECLCVLVRDRNDPKLGFKINATLALALPATCHAPINISQCTALLHLKPNSPEAKVFEDFANSTKGTNPTQAHNGKTDSGDSGPSGQVKSDGGRVVAEAVWGGLVWCLTSQLVFLYH